MIICLINQVTVLVYKRSQNSFSLTRWHSCAHFVRPAVQNLKAFNFKKKKRKEKTAETRVHKQFLFDLTEELYFLLVILSTRDLTTLIEHEMRNQLVQNSCGAVVLQHQIHNINQSDSKYPVFMCFFLMKYIFKLIYKSLYSVASEPDRYPIVGDDVNTKNKPNKPILTSIYPPINF